MWKKNIFSSFFFHSLLLIIVAVGSYYLGAWQEKKQENRTNVERQTDTCPSYIFPTYPPSNALQSPKPPLSVHLEPLALAPVGNPMRLCLTVVSLVDAPNTRVFFTLPQDVIVSKGLKGSYDRQLTEQTLILPENIAKSFEIEIQFREPGIKKIEAAAESVHDGGSWSEFAGITLDVSETKTIVVEDAVPSAIEGDQQTIPLKSIEQNFLFTGNNTFTEVDANGDGIYEALQVTVEVHTSASGEYSISGSLGRGNTSVATTPSFEHQGVTHASFTSGAGVSRHKVNIAFSGEQIFRSGLDGPYDLFLSGVGPDTAFAQETFTTSAIDHTRYGEVPVVLTTATDRAIDSDNDGDFDFLTVEITINVRVGGKFFLQSDLSKNNVSIVGAGSVFNLETGKRLVSLQFSGLELRRSGQDGPYSGTVSLIDATGHTLQSISFTTQSYRSSSFGASTGG